MRTRAGRGGELRRREARSKLTVICVANVENVNHLDNDYDDDYNDDEGSTAFSLFNVYLNRRISSTLVMAESVWHRLFTSMYFVMVSCSGSGIMTEAPLFLLQAIGADAPAHQPRQLLSASDRHACARARSS